MYKFMSGIENLIYPVMVGDSKKIATVEEMRRLSYSVCKKILLIIGALFEVVKPFLTN